jgi:hypothetical protein
MRKCLQCEKQFVVPINNPRKKYCSRACGRKHYYNNHKTVEQEQNARWYQNNRESELEKNRLYRQENKERFYWYHNKHRFNGLRDEVLKRDGYQCGICGTYNNLIVHHIDGHGYTNGIPNNSLDNLMTLCKFCHTNLHWWQKKNKMFQTAEDIVRTMGRPVEVMGKYHNGNT